MAVLHTKTTHRSWGRASRSALDALFPGIDWSSFIVAIQSDPIGSGCIAQVIRTIFFTYIFASSCVQLVLPGNGNGREPFQLRKIQHHTEFISATFLFFGTNTFSGEKNITMKVFFDVFYPSVI